MPKMKTHKGAVSGLRLLPLEKSNAVARIMRINFLPSRLVKAAFEESWRSEGCRCSSREENVAISFLVEQNRR